ncbi:PilZ domain protein [bacterium BMS3Abin09]|nr:PilZ domain protein [bacterium BMS3Abin09]GBE41704.1 PilZ domain protein [bacterium BMS3Bbin09]HDN95108.1 PilZ domain-containing protein [Nitrospirota bacterium]HDO66807.1 PilZ domain-containing protein [Nitrospirota bacterium]HEW80981.1 PilZ domain-containing protein [Nitrospirota bacterium]
MEYRACERISDSLDADITLDGVNYSGIIMNYSEEGLFLVSATLYDVDDVDEKTEMEVRCILPSEEKVDLKCEVKWFNKKDSPYGVSLNMGMRILGPPEKYIEFIRGL